MVNKNIDIPENILLVVKDTNWKIDVHSNDENRRIKQAFVVDTRISSSIKTAINWGTVTKEIKYKADSMRYRVTEVLEPIEIYTSNNNFKLSILEEADTSSQGGKLSFWNCLIEKEEIGFKAVVGISQANLASMIKQSTIIKGVVQERLRLIRVDGNAGVVHDGMHEWKNSIQQLRIKTGTINKTSKWELGHNYISKTLNQLYIGKVYKWFNDEEKVMNGPNLTSIVTLNKQPVELHMTMNLDANTKITQEVKDGKITTLSGIFNRVAEIINSREGKTLFVIEYATGIFFGQGNILKKLPSRQVGTVKIEIDDYEEAKQRMLDAYHSMLIHWCPGIKNMGYMEVDRVGYTSSADKKPEISEKEIETLRRKYYRDIIFELDK